VNLSCRTATSKINPKCLYPAKNRQDKNEERPALKWRVFSCFQKVFNNQSFLSICGSGSVFRWVWGGGYKKPPPVAVLRELGVGLKTQSISEKPHEYTQTDIYTVNRTPSHIQRVNRTPRCTIHDNSFINFPILVKHRNSTVYIKAGHSAGFSIY